MYAETGLLFPYYQNYSQEFHQFEDFCGSHKSNVPMGNLVQTSTIFEYDMGGEGDLFKAPEPIIEEPLMSIDPMAASASMISFAEDVISPQALKAADIESIQNEHLSEVFYECKKDLMAKGAMETPLSEILDIKIPIIRPEEENLYAEDKLPLDGTFQKSVSSGCLTSMEWIHGPPMRPNFLDFSGMDLDVVYGMRRAFSEGDMETLANGMSLIHSPLSQTQTQTQYVGNCSSDARKEKLSRYRSKRTKRNFGRKIKYACRKALADSQPRIRGRFAKTEETDGAKKR